MDSKLIDVFYRASGNNVLLVNLPVFNFLMVDGEGQPDGIEFQEAAQTIYTITYLIKFALPQEERSKVSPMEVIWFLDREKKSFRWTMMIRQPEIVNEKRVEMAIQEAIAKKKTCYPERLRFAAFSEGNCAQILHKGPYTEMNTTLKRMTDYLHSIGLECERDTHDIYLNDSRKTKPVNLKTIMRVKIL